VRSWTPQRLYEAKPWVFVCVGVLLAVGMMVWSLIEGLWMLWRSLLCLGGMVLAIVDYRARSKWRREKGP